MNRIQRCLAVLAGLGGAMIALAAATPAAFAMIVPPPGGTGGPAVPPAHTVVTGGMPGWQITLIAVAAALAAAATAVILDRILDRAAPPGPPGHLTRGIPDPVALGKPVIVRGPVGMPDRVVRHGDAPVGTSALIMSSAWLSQRFLTVPLHSPVRKTLRRPEPRPPLRQCGPCAQTRDHPRRLPRRGS